MRFSCTDWAFYLGAGVSKGQKGLLGIFLGRGLAGTWSPLPNNPCEGNIRPGSLLKAMSYLYWECGAKRNEVWSPLSGISQALPRGLARRRLIPSFPGKTLTSRLTASFTQVTWRLSWSRRFLGPLLRFYWNKKINLHWVHWMGGEGLRTENSIWTPF